MNSNDAAQIIYDYVVRGWSMQDIADDLGINSSDVSYWIHAYGFNSVYQGSYQSGQSRGAYRNGYTYKFEYKGRQYNYKLKVTEEIVYDFVCEYNYVTRDDPCNPEDFDEFLDGYAHNAAQNELNERIQQEQQRRAQQAAAQRAAQQEAYRRQQEEQRRQEELRRQQEEQRRRQEEQARKNKWNSLCNEGIALYNQKRYSDALHKLQEAERMYTSDKLSRYIALTATHFPNHAYWASDIIRRLTNYKRNNNLDFDDFMALAQAYLDNGDKGIACDNFFFAGDIAYDKEDYVLADKIYTEALNKTNLYSGNSKLAPFRIAYARSQKSNLTQDDYGCIIHWYKKAIEKNVENQWSYNNLASAYIKSGRNEEAIEACKEAINHGLTEKQVYINWMNACYNMKDYSVFVTVAEQAISRGYSANLFQIAYSCEQIGNKVKAEQYYKESIRVDNEPASYWNLAVYYRDSGRLSEAVSYAENAIKFFNQENRDKCGAAALKIANKAGNDAAYNRMLQYLPIERERLENERRERERREQERLEQERLEQERKKKARILRAEEQLLLIM